jgi:DNA-binding MarR family transcriptional regulator
MGELAKKLIEKGIPFNESNYDNKTKEKKFVKEPLTRRKIYDFIIKNPGFHLREISRETAIPKTTLKYHLDFLEKVGLIARTSEDGFSRYFTSNEIGIKERKVFKSFRIDIAQQIILLFLIFICLSRLELSRELELSPTTVDYYLKKLIKLGIIEPSATSKDGVIFNWGKEKKVMKYKSTRNKIFYNLKSPFFVYRVLIAHEDSLLKDEFFRSIFLFIIEDYSPLPDKVESFPSAVDSIRDVFYELIPVPFCA